MTDVAVDPTPIEILHCDSCGCLIEDLEALINLRAADLVTQWELADPRDAWRHTGEAAPPESVRSSAHAAPGRRAHRPTQSTVDAFWYVVSLCDPRRLKAWLDDHPQDAPFLLKLLEGK